MKEDLSTMAYLLKMIFLMALVLPMITLKKVIIACWNFVTMMTIASAKQPILIG